MTATPTPSLEEGTIIDGKWEILSHIATGGKGEVYLARQTNLDRKVAFKTISRAFLESLEGDTDEIGAELDRFRREVKVMAKLRHPNVLQVYDYGEVTQEGRQLHYLAMEYVPGPTLKLTMDEQGFGEDEEAIRQWLRRYFLPTLDGVEAVHAEGIVHRDLKPANVLLDDDTPKIADFGLAGGGVNDSITRSHHIIGTMPYMPEEQFVDLTNTDIRADVYALGKILYEAVIGKLTKENSPLFKTAALKDPQTPFMKELDHIIRNATAYNRSERLPTVRALREAVVCLLDKQCEPGKASHASASGPRISPTMWVFLSGLLLALLTTGLLYHFWGMEPSLTPTELKELEIMAQSLANQGKGSSAALEKNPSTPAVTVSPQPSAPKLRSPDGELKPSITGLDGATMFLVQDDDLAFYMAQTQITNHQYLEFLRVAPNVSVKDNSVYGGDVLWLYLGEIKPGYDPIHYQDGRFILTPEAALTPVVRVTPLGAEAYARHYRQTLPTMQQWKTAKRQDEGQRRQGSPSSPTGETLFAAMDHMMTPQSSEPQPAPLTLEPRETLRELFPVVETSANSLGIRGLGENVNEWVVEPRPGGGVEFHIHGGIGLDDGAAYLKRNRWEAFANVGFRTVITAPDGK